MKFSLVLAALVLTSGAALADPEPLVRPVLEISGGMCSSTRAYVMDWARSNDTLGAYAIPALASVTSGDCTPIPGARAAHSAGFSNQAEADAMALAKCVELNASTNGANECLIIARLRPGPL